MTVGTPSLLAQHIQRESQSWEARHRTGRACILGSSVSSRDSDTTTADDGSLFSSPRSGSRRSSISSAGGDDGQLPRPPLPFQLQQQQQQRAPVQIPVYGSLAEAAAQSTLRILGGDGGEGEVRRLVTPGKLYENEEDDDAIVYDDGDDDDRVAAG